MMKSQLKWSTTWWKWVRFYRRRFVDRWIFAGGIDHFLVAYSLGFIVRISVRANLNDRVVIDEVPIGGRVGPSIGFVVASCLTAAWNVVVEFLRLQRNSKPIVVVSLASCSWVGAQDHRRAPLFLLLSRVLKIVVVHRSSYSDRRRVPLWMMTFWTGIACPSGTSRRRSTMPWVHKDESQRFPLPGAPLSTSGCQIFDVGSVGISLDAPVKCLS
jgi:hypothetical protein